ncbi:MAG: hypothetical protein ACYC96_06865 [Fimbriimonadaceae bacterium]
MQTAAVVAGLAGLACGASAQLSENFETPGWASAGSTYLKQDAGTPANQTDGWTVEGNTGTSGIDIVAAAYNVSAGTNDGQWVDLAGTPGPGGIENSFSISTAGDYSVNFSSFSNDKDSSGIGTGTYGFVVLLDTTNPSGPSVHNYADQLTTKWTSYTLDLGNLTTGSHTLEFYTPAPNNGNVGLDTIKLRPGATPEPFTIGLGIAGLAVAVRRIRTRAKAAS